ncbi:MAG: KilA-N domain-containing protein [Fusobacterium sp.]|uniref:KilA-N domain-containing protein n=1 Tax=Fusobacterium sp. TaxID=68766 RepID=UPI0039941C61
MSKLIIKEYLGKSIKFKVINGRVYANATTMCKIFDKKANDWLKMKVTEELINEISNESGIPDSELVITKRGGNTKEQGTWIYEELVLELAGWLDVKFRRWCQKQIATLLRDGKVEIKTVKTNKFDLLMKIITANTDIERALAINQYESNYVKPLELENKAKNETIEKQVQELEYKEDVILGLTKDIELKDKRQILNTVVRYKGADFKERWRLLYFEFEKKYHIDIKRRMKNYNNSHKDKIKTKIEYIEKILNNLPQLYEIACKLFQGDINQIIENYKKIC